MPTQTRSSSSGWREAEPQVVGCPGCGCWRGREAYLAKGYCQPRLTLHSENKDIKHMTGKRESPQSLNNIKELQY